MEVKTERTKNPNKRPNPSTMLLVNRFYHVQKHEIIIKNSNPSYEFLVSSERNYDESQCITLCRTGGNSNNNPFA